jgi:thioredoxin 1
MNVTVIDLFMTSCAPCKVLSPIIDQLQEQYPTVTFRKVDVNTSEGAQFAGKFGVRKAPTVLFLDDDGNSVSPNLVGVIDKTKYQETLNTLIGE